MAEEDKILPVGQQALAEIQRHILLLRGKQVLLDFQLAAMYGVETKVLNQAVKRNINRFPEDFMFRLTRQEVAFMRSQIVTSYTQTVENHKMVISEKRRCMVNVERTHYLTHLRSREWQCCPAC